jgi:hypothetical protein
MGSLSSTLDDPRYQAAACVLCDAFAKRPAQLNDMRHPTPAGFRAIADHNNGLRQGAGHIAPLKLNVNFRRYPHRTWLKPFINCFRYTVRARASHRRAGDPPSRTLGGRASVPPEPKAHRAARQAGLRFEQEVVGLARDSPSRAGNVSRLVRRVVCVASCRPCQRSPEPPP